MRCAVARFKQLRYVQDVSRFNFQLLKLLLILMVWVSPFSVKLVAPCS